MNTPIAAHVDLYIPFDFNPNKIIGRKAIFDKTMELPIRPMKGEELWIHHFFADAATYDGEYIICTITSIGHGTKVVDGKPVPMFYVEAELMTEDQYHEERMRQIHQSLKDNGWKLGSIT